MLNDRRKRVRFLLLGLLLLATLFGMIGVVVHRANGNLADVTVTTVTQYSNPDEVEVYLQLRMSGKGTCSWVRRDKGLVKVSPVVIGTNSDVSLLDWYLRPLEVTYGTGVAFQLKSGEDFQVHVPASLSKWLRSGKDVVLVSSSRDGVPMRSIALRFEPTAE